MSGGDIATLAIKLIAAPDTDRDAGPAALLREHLHPSALLAAVALGDKNDARRRLASLGALPPSSHAYAMVRAYLQALATLL